MSSTETSDTKISSSCESGGLEINQEIPASKSI